MKMLFYILSIFFLIIGMYLVILNWILFWKSYVKKQHTGSWVPLIAGVLVMIGFILYPENNVKKFCWIGLLIDPAGIPGILYTIWQIHKYKHKINISKISKMFTDNDIYFMELVSDKLIINDNYNGVFILDHGLNMIKELKLFNDMSIYMSFIKDREIVLYCEENQCLVHINIDTYEYKIFPLSKEFEDIVFMPFYEWVDNDLILLSDNGNIMAHVDLLNHTATIIQENSEDYKSKIYNNWKKLSGKVVYKVYPDECHAVVESNSKMVLYNYQKDEESILMIDPTHFYNNDISSSYRYHDIEVKNGVITEISERNVSILYKKEQIILGPESKDDFFIRGKLIRIAGNDYLFLLQGSNSDPLKSVIEKYDLSLLSDPKKQEKGHDEILPGKNNL